MMLINNILLGFVVFFLIGVVAKLERIANDTTTLATIALTKSR